jgi:hypothetical protein
MDPEVRRNGLAAELIAEDFAEFGGNGRISNKTDAAAMMPIMLPAFSLWKSLKSARANNGRRAGNLPRAEPKQRRRNS